MSAEQPQAAPHTHGSVIHWARLYHLLERLPFVGGDARHREALDHAALQPGERVLDVGCGPGTLALLAKERAGDGEVHGIDPSSQMIELAAERAEQAGLDVSFQTAVIEDLPFPDASLDLVFSTYMLHHLPDEVKQAGLREVARVLKPGGRMLAIDITGKGSIFWWIMRFAGHRVADDYPDELAAMMRDAGLSPELLPSVRAQEFSILARKGND